MITFRAALSRPWPPSRELPGHAGESSDQFTGRSRIGHSSGPGDRDCGPVAAPSRVSPRRIVVAGFCAAWIRSTRNHSAARLDKMRASLASLRARIVTGYQLLVGALIVAAIVTACGNASHTSTGSGSSGSSGHAVAAAAPHWRYVRVLSRTYRLSPPGDLARPQVVRLSLLRPVPPGWAVIAPEVFPPHDRP
jgi:hypothetical protein